MKSRTYQAVTMAEALGEVKKDLGRDAVILQTRRVRKGGLLGLGGRPMWEITAAPNASVPRRAMEGKYVPVPSATAATATLEAPGADKSAHEASDRLPSEAVDRQLADIHKMVEALLDLQGNNDKAAELPPTLQAFHGHLLRQDVDEEIAASLIGKLRLTLTGQEMLDKQLIRERLTDMIGQRIAVGEPQKRHAARHSRVISLLGPTGVGKTTTIAKLAANFKLRESKTVGLITIDTYRIAAVDQLKTYAEILDVPLRVVLTAGDLQQAVESMAQLDVVLIDTAGRSQNDHLRLNQLRTFISAAQADEVHLVVAATASRSTIRSSLERFVPLGVSRIILTKLDEAGTFGTILNIAAAEKAALSYVTTGQDVPDDIAPADPVRLATCIIRGSLHAS